MTLRIWDTRVQGLREFAPLDPGHVTVYVCGATVQSGPHLGHLRSALSFDILRRWLGQRHETVTFVRNVTDIDDKILERARDEPWWALAYRIEHEFAAAYAAIGILPPTYEPRATGAVPDMIALIEALLARGHAYAADDGSGDVYFDVRSWPEYGTLTHQTVDAMEAGAEGESRGKRDSHDFALWKGAKPTEPPDAAWPAPWGRGRPGWHIECSAMARRYLGTEFDIHGGGLDLRFPHHENERAQSRAAGDAFARYWVHNGLVTVAGQKMSKSLGNVVAASEVLRSHDPLVVRYALGAAHYRSTLDLGAASFDDAASAVERIRGFLLRVRRGSAVDDRAAGRAASAPAPGFAEAMDDDLNVPEALAAVHEAVRRGNSALDAGRAQDARAEYDGVRAALGVLGLDPLDPAWRAAGDPRADRALSEVVDRMLEERQAARAARDWAVADRIRDALAEAGVILEDSSEGTHWSLHG